MADILTPDAIRALWIQAGGNPQHADKAVQYALAFSGGNPDTVAAGNPAGTSSRGLWGISSQYGKQSSTDPLENAKAAVALSNNGSDWSAFSASIPDIPSPIEALWPDEWTPEFGLRVFGYWMMGLAGAMLMMVGVTLMFLNSERTKSRVRAIFGTVVSGAGFGVGAAAASRVGGGMAASDPFSNATRALRTDVKPRIYPQTPPPGASVRMPRRPLPTRGSGARAVDDTLDLSFLRSQASQPQSRGIRWSPSPATPAAGGPGAPHGPSRTVGKHRKGEPADALFD